MITINVIYEFWMQYDCSGILGSRLYFHLNVMVWNFLCKSGASCACDFTLAVLAFCKNNSILNTQVINYSICS